MRTIVDRIDRVLYLLNEMSTDSDEFIRSRANLPWISRIKSALFTTRDTFISHPSDYEEYITVQFLYEEIGYFLGDNMDILQTSVGSEVSSLNSDISYMLLIRNALTALEREVALHPSEYILTEVYDLLLRMTNAFDASFHRNNNQLKFQGESIISLIERRGMHLYHGEFKKKMYDLLTHTPYYDD